MEIIALLVKSPLIAVLVSILLALVYLWLKRVMEQTFGLGIRRCSRIWVQAKLIILRRHEVI